MHHPFDYIRAGVRDRMIFPLVGSGLLLFFLLYLVGLPLVTPAAPYGIVSFELARNPAQAQAIIDSWSQRAQLRAAFSLGLDFLFIPIYSTGLSLCCLWAAQFQRERRRFSNWLVLIGIPGVLLAWAQTLAGGLDLVENLALSNMLLGSVSSPWPQVSSICAVVKFNLIGIGILYTLLAVLAYAGAVVINRQRMGN